MHKQKLGRNYDNFRMKGDNRWNKNPNKHKQVLDKTTLGLNTANNLQLWLDLEI